MAKRVMAQDIRIVDPMFSIPEGLAGHVYQDDPSDLYSNSTDGVENQETDEEGVVLSDSYLVDEVWDDTEDYSGALETPEGLTVVEQKLRVSNTGNQVVDLVVDIPDVAGARKYEFRVTVVE